MLIERKLYFDLFRYDFLQGNFGERKGFKIRQVMGTSAFRAN